VPQPVLHPPTRLLLLRRPPPPPQVATAVVVVVLDLSDPASVLPSAHQWLGLVNSKLTATYSLFERKGLQVPEQLRARASAALFAQHADKALVNHSGEWVCVCVCGCVGGWVVKQAPRGT
jgi:hypothetical protein